MQKWPVRIIIREWHMQGWLDTHSTSFWKGGALKFWLAIILISFTRAFEIQSPVDLLLSISSGKIYIIIIELPAG